ncbi:MAG: hypothetical protein K9H84_06035 [Bacteroidales bacterium]|nr:hypothetical protein [Bacteroidales bacterium]
MTRQDYKKQLDQKLESGFEIDIRATINNALRYFQMEPLQFFGYTSFLILVSLLTIRFQPVGSIVNIFILPVLSSGYFYAAAKMDRNEKLSFYDFFQGFNSWLNIIVGATLTSLITILGFALLILPGIYFAVSYSFLYPFLVNAGFDYWDAMEASRKLVTKNFWDILGLVLGLILLNIFGLMLFGIGILITLPVTYLSIYSAFKSIFPESVTTFKKDPSKIDLRHFR